MRKDREREDGMSETLPWRLPESNPDNCLYIRGAGGGRLGCGLFLLSTEHWYEGVFACLSLRFSLGSPSAFLCVRLGGFLPGPLPVGSGSGSCQLGPYLISFPLLCVIGFHGVVLQVTAVSAASAAVLGLGRSPMLSLSSLVIWFSCLVAVLAVAIRVLFPRATIPVTETFSALWFS